MSRGSYLGEGCITGEAGRQRSPFTVKVTSFAAEIVFLDKKYAPELCEATIELLIEHRMSVNVARDGTSAVVQQEADWADYKVS